MNTLTLLLSPFLHPWLKWLIQRKVPQTEGTLRLKGLNSGVKVLRDRWGIPHIYAKNIHDLLFAQGFVHAQDRLWQMDLQRRVAAGRLSEILGKRLVAIDRWLRILGFRRSIENNTGMLDRDLRHYIEAYSAGINSYMSRGNLPLEFSLLRYSPHQWSIVDSLSWNMVMSWNLSVNWESEIIRAALIDYLGKDIETELEPGYAPHWPSIIPHGLEVMLPGTQPLMKNYEARSFLGPSPRDGIGSNSWVLSGTKTASGAPLLANDMHLVMNLPCIWYENHLICQDMNITGISAPGVPFIISEHNGYVTWGFTAGLSDVQDLFKERIRNNSKGILQYEYKGKWYDTRIVTEEIKVKKRHPVIEKVVITRHGPIINKLAPDFSKEQPLALAWTAYERDTTLKALHKIIRARNCRKFHEALEYWTSPNVNILFADIEGNIAYTLAGRVPIRKKGDGKVPVPGWTGEYDWKGFIPFKELPHLFNPKQGYIVTANNRIITRDYPYFLGNDYCSGDRAERITEMIEAKEAIDIEYIKQMQYDVLSPTARRINEQLKRKLIKSPKIKSAVELLKGWDGEMNSNSSAAALYQVFIRSLLSLALHKKLGHLTQYYMGMGPTPMLGEYSMFCWRAWEWLQRELLKEKSFWFETDHRKESENDIIHGAFQKAVKFLNKELGHKIEKWSWGKLHSLTFMHPLGRVKVFGRILNRGEFTLGGDGTTIWASYSSMHNLDTTNMIGPPFRFIADCKNLNNSIGILTPGQSGNPGSIHYDNQIDAWFKGTYHPILYNETEVKKEIEAQLELLPESQE